MLSARRRRAFFIGRGLPALAARKPGGQPKKRYKRRSGFRKAGRHCSFAAALFASASVKKIAVLKFGATAFLENQVRAHLSTDPLQASIFMVPGLSFAGKQILSAVFIFLRLCNNIAGTG